MSIITFYSYKGGVGRTMALANVAVLLARKHRVLVVDWDLEAPGIERYFTELGIRAEGQGLLPLLTDVAARRRPAYRDYTCEVTAPDDGITLRLLPSGREADPEYYRRLESFEWAAFYRSRGGDYLERLRGQWLSDFDFVLIDSRTGLSDAGGVCTILLPDIVVAMFTPAHQSLYGVRDVMRLAQQARHRLAYDRGALSVVPVASRVDRTHPLYADWRTRFASELGEFPSAWLPRDADLAVVLDRLAIGYEPGVSHGERLVALSSDLEVAQLRSSYERLATLLAGDLADLSPVIGAPPPDPRPRATLRSLRPSGPRSSQSAREAAWRLNRTAAAAATTKAADYEWDVFVSYPRTPHVTVWLSEQLLPRLQGSMASTLDPVPKIFMDRAEVATAERWAAAQRSVLARSRVMLAIVSA
ncbi:MAG: ParA family protein [Deltaproteobacteria bacterium]|nr:MAG: ParA family protein [Deltaproteobacteria bacterium]